MIGYLMTQTSQGAAFKRFRYQLVGVTEVQSKTCKPKRS